MHVTIPHKLSKEAALTKVKGALDRARPELSTKAQIGEERWDGDTLYFAFIAEGQSIQGTFEVTEEDFILNVKLPLMLRMFEGKIEKMISEQAAKLLQ